MLRRPYSGRSILPLPRDRRERRYGDRQRRKPLGLYREGDLTVLRVTGLGGLLDLPEALGIDHDGKAATSLTTRTRAPIISVPPVAPKRHSASQKAAPPLPRTSASPCSVPPATGANCTRSMCTRIPHFHLSAPRGRFVPLLAHLLTSRLYIVGEQEVRRKTARSQEN